MNKLLAALVASLFAVGAFAADAVKPVAGTDAPKVQAAAGKKAAKKSAKKAKKAAAEKAATK